MSEPAGERERFARLKTLFHEAASLDLHGRRDFLDALSGDDEALSAELAEMLAAHDLEDDPFKSQAAWRGECGTAAANEPLDAWLGRRLGAYRLERVIGRGGMGAVYLGERVDGEIEQRVAIKVVLPGFTTAEVLTRFRAERQVLSNLDHPNIARLLDAGATDEGLPFLVMEHVEGQDVESYCATRGLGLEARLQLLLTVCDAVDHAHRNLVVHRDIKPANILVTEAGVVKLLDFGIAKLLADPGTIEPRGLTQTAPAAMTPAFASPEQLSGGVVTTAADVYALGLLLHRLLTGRHPFALTGRTYFDLARAVCGGELPLPSSVARSSDSEPFLPPPESDRRRLARLLDGDLDAITARATRLEPGQRYSSAIALADDLRRYLDGLPVEARQGDRRYRFVKLLRRHRASVAAATLLLLSLVGGIVATTQQARRAMWERERADRRFAELRQLAHAVVFEYHDAIGDLPGSTPVRAAMVKDALVYLDGLAHDAAGDLDLQRELAEAYGKIGDVQGNAYAANLGDSKGALESYGKSLELLEALAAARPDDAEIASALGRGYERQADVLWDTSALDSALAAYQRARATIDAALARNPGSLDLRARLAQVYAKLGELHGNPEWANLGDLSGGIALERKGLALRQEVADAKRRDPAALYSLVISQQTLAAMLIAAGDLDEADRLARQGLTNAEAVVELGSGGVTDRRMVGSAHQVVGDVAFRRGDDDAAIASYSSQLEIMKLLLEGDPTNQQLRRDVLVARHHLARSLLRAGRVAEALEQARGALVLAEVARKAGGENRQVRADVAMCQRMVGEALAASGDREDAARMLGEARDLRTALAAEDPSDRQAQRELESVAARLGELQHKSP